MKKIQDLKCLNGLTLKLLAMALLTFPDRGESSALTACLEGMMQK